MAAVGTMSLCRKPTTRTASRRVPAGGAAVSWTAKSFVRQVFIRRTPAAVVQAVADTLGPVQCRRILRIRRDGRPYNGVTENPNPHK